MTNREDEPCPATVTFAATADLSLEVCEHFLIERLDMPLSRVEQISLDLVSTAAERLALRPQTYPVCRLAMELGIGYYQELLIDGYRVIYRHWPEQREVAIYLFAHQRQDFKALLFEYQLFC